MLNIPVTKEAVQQHVDTLFNFVPDSDPDLAEHRANDAWCQILGMQKIVSEAEKQFFVFPDIDKVDKQALFEYFEIREIFFNGLKKAELAYEQAVDAQAHRNRP